MRYSSLRNLLLLLIISVIGVACGDSTTGSHPDSATVNGRVDNTSSNSSSEKVQQKSLEGAIVTAARVSSSGQLQSIGNAETETNAEGEFSLQINGDAVANAGNQIVIVAEKNGQKAKAFLTEELESGSSVQVQPITFESSAEASVYQKVVAHGDTELVSKADIEAMVDESVAMDIESNADHAAELATALAARAEALATFYSRQGIEITNEQMDNIQQIKMQAQLELEDKLNATTSAEQQQAAIEAFLKTVAKAQTEADISASAAAEAWESSSRVLFKQSADLSADARAAVRKNVAYMTTYTMEMGVEAQMKATGATESSISAAADAAATLRSNISAMSDASQANIEAAFEDFNNQVVAIMENDANVSGDLFASANATINQNNGIKASFESSLKSSLQLSVIMDTYAQFYSDVGSVVESTFSSASDAQLKAYTQLLILINVAN